MIWTRGIMVTTQSEYIISPPNKGKVPITNMQLASKQYLGFISTQTTRGMKSILKMVMVVMMVLMEMPPPKPRRCCDDDGVDSPSLDAQVWQDMPSPEVG
jgi:hypothetical protein